MKQTLIWPSSSTPKTSPAMLILLAAFCVVLLPLLTHTLLLHPPEYDELLHLLSSRSFNQTGQLAIADGYYTRATLYTKITAFFTRFGSDELLMARLPALLAGAILTALLGSWVGYRIGWLAGIATAMVFAIAPSTIHLSVLIRFYTLHALVATSMWIVAYESLRAGIPWAWKLPGIVVVIGLFMLALHLQLLTLITAAGTTAAIFCVLLFDYRQPIQQYFHSHVKFSFFLLLIAAGLTTLFLHFASDILFEKLRGTTPVWSEGKADNIGFYIIALGTFMPMIWPLFPIMALAALIKNTRVAIFCLVLFFVAFIISSLASQKATRYIYHFYPVICVIWGIGFQALLTAAISTIKERTRFSSATTIFLVFVSIGAMIINTEEFRRSVKLITGKGTLDKSIPVLNEPDWVVAREPLNTLLKSAEDVIVSVGVKSLYAFERYDFELSGTVVRETDTAVEFGLDIRTGRRVISTLDSIVKVVDDPGLELMVFESRLLNQNYGVSNDIVHWLDENCSSVAVPQESLLSAWSCTQL